jgi:hypothetical protein
MWSSVSGASRYEMQLQNLATRKTVASVQNINAQGWTPTTDLTTGQYRWWVRAIGPGNLAGVWSSAADFHVGGQTRIITPVGTGTDTTPVFSWRPVDGATTYRLWVDRIDVSQSKVIFLTDLTTTSFTPTVAMAAGTYRVWVQAVSSNGTSSPWSPTVSFTITADAEGAGPSAEASLLTTLLPGNLPGPDPTASVRRWPGRSDDRDNDHPRGADFDEHDQEPPGMVTHNAALSALEQDQAAPESAEHVTPQRDNMGPYPDRPAALRRMDLTPPLYENRSSHADVTNVNGDGTRQRRQGPAIDVVRGHVPS